MKITNIDWDTDGESIEGLPTEVIINQHIDEDAVADYLSDEYGFCIKSLSIENDPELPDNSVLMEFNKDYLIPIKDGYLTITKAADPDYPGVYIGFCQKPGSMIQDIALIESNEEQYPNKIRAHLWEDEQNDSSTYDVTINRANLTEEAQNG